MRGASSLGLSPDGRSLYLSAYATDTLFTFRRGGSGRLRFAACVSADASGGCRASAAGSLAGTAGVAVSPNGADVYVAAGLGRTLSRFSRAPDGSLTFGSCVANAGAGGCSEPSRDTLTGATAVAVGPGGGDIYVASFDAAVVSHFRRTADGSLELAGCIADAGSFGCRKTPGNVLEGAGALALSPDGEQLYVGSSLSGSISRFARRADGSLRFRDCIADNGANGCRKADQQSLIGVTGLAISHNGERLFAAAQTGFVTSLTRRKGGGKLTYSDCIGDDGARGCGRPGHRSLGLASGIAVIGRDLYVASQGGDSITRLRSGGGGALEYASCVAARRAGGCRRGPKVSLDGVYAIAAAGRDLYAAAPEAGAVSALRRPR